jgi:hypothetical protein
MLRSLVFLVVSASCGHLLPAGEVRESYFGEPVRLRGRFMYFTSWQYVRPGVVSWQTQGELGEEPPLGLLADGTRPARFEPRDMPRGIRLVAQPANKEPLPEGQPIAQVLEDGKYKTWYTIGPCVEPEPFSSKDRILPGHNHHLAYAESEDGVTWHLPKLGLFEFGGNRDNNLVFRGDLSGSTRGWHGGSVFVDPSSPAERYKMIYLGIITDEEWERFEQKYPGQADTMARRPDVGGFRCVFGVFGAVSPDGIHWQSLPEPLMIQHADTINTCYYDVDRQQYVAYVRAWQVNRRVAGYEAPNSTSWIDVGRRSIGRAVSDDFRHFDKPQLAVTIGADSPPSHVLYTNGKTTLPGCEDHHVMFPWIWEMERDGGSVWLYSSPDGWSWSRVPGGPVVSAGVPGQPDGGHVLCFGNLLPYPDGTWKIGYSGSPIPHKYPGRDVNRRQGLFPGVPAVSGLASWTRGRLVALQADDEGQFATVAVVPPGNRIRLNVTVAPTGRLQVAVRCHGSHDELAERGFSDCDPIVGDHLAQPVCWKGDASLGHDGKPVSLRFRMKHAKLYGVEFY